MVKINLFSSSEITQDFPEIRLQIVVLIAAYEVTLGKAIEVPSESVGLGQGVEYVLICDGSNDQILYMVASALAGCLTLGLSVDVSAATHALSRQVRHMARLSSRLTVFFICSSCKMVGLVVIKQSAWKTYFPDTQNQRDVRSAFIRLFGTCISLPLKRIHYKIKGEVFWLGVILLIFLLSFHQWIIDHSSPLQQQGLPQTYTAFSFPLDLFSFFLSPERPILLISITH